MRARSRAACLFVGVACLLACLTASPTSALATSQQAEKPTSPGDAGLEARTAAIASTLRCPVCQGESIQDSPAELAQQMRAVVKERLRAGESPEQIQAYFMSKYGEWILLEPRRTGLNLLLYALPIALVIGGLVLVAVLVKRWTAPESNPGQTS
ncbi:MAG TPA: cytochrome c-type biogenesis protein [Gemmatimonadaceae bacterium]|nr:cytochrome c-type biogenesis protein [Gemmatimonadaceae bacterium]